MTTVFTAHDDAWKTSGWVRFSQTIPLDANCQSVTTGGMPSVDGAWLTPQDATEDWALHLPFFGATAELYGTILRTVNTARPMSIILKLDDTPTAAEHVVSGVAPIHGSTPAQCGVLLATVSAPLGQHTLSVTGSHDGNWFALYNVTVSQKALASPRPSSPPSSSEPPTSPSPSRHPSPEQSDPPSPPSNPSTPLSESHGPSPAGLISSSSSLTSPSQTAEPSSIESRPLSSTTMRMSDSESSPRPQATTADAQPTDTDPPQVGDASGSQRRSLQPGSIAAIVVTVVLAAILCAFAVIFCRRRSRRSRTITAPFEQIQEQQYDAVQRPVTLQRDQKVIPLHQAAREEAWSDTETSSREETAEGATDVSEAVELVHAVRNAGFTTQALLSSLSRVHDSSSSDDPHPPPQYVH